MSVSAGEHMRHEVINVEIAGLSRTFFVNPNSCSNPSFYEEYIRYCALDDQISGRNVVHVLFDETEKRIVGFISLCAGSLISEEDDGAVLGKPAITISALAVDRDYEGQGVGRKLIDIALDEAYLLYKKHIGIRYLILTATEKAVEFYKKCDFALLSDGWESVPTDQWSVDCIPMYMELHFDCRAAEFENEKYDDDLDMDFPWEELRN